MKAAKAFEELEELENKIEEEIDRCHRNQGTGFHSFAPYQGDSIFNLIRLQACIFDIIGDTGHKDYHVRFDAYGKRDLWLFGSSIVGILGRRPLFVEVPSAFSIISSLVGETLMINSNRLEIFFPLACKPRLLKHSRNQYRARPLLPELRLSAKPL